jgi:phosphatidylglycerol:prolipoprotein diacylglycerol transferase
VHPVLFRIPGIDWPLHSYGVLIVTGFLLAMYVAWREARRVRPGLEEEVLDFAFWALVGGMIGARVVFIVVNWKDYAKNPLDIFVIWKGGLVFYGAAIGGFLAFVWFAKKRGYSTTVGLMIADIIIVGVPLAHVFGRFGCIAAGCCWGGAHFHFDDVGAVIADIPLAARFPEGSLAYSSLVRSESPEIVEAMRATGLTMPLFPSQLAEAFGEGLVFLTLLVVRSRKWFHGQVLMTYGLLYPILRFTLEFFRGDAERGMAILSTSQFISLAVAAASIIGILVLRKRGMARFGPSAPVTA